MNKILRYSFMLLMAFLGINANAAVDVLTYDVLLESGKGNTYQDFSGKTISSTAVYAGNASSGADKYIQLRTNNNNAGIVTTASGGKLTSVTIKFNSATTDRKIQIYGKNSAYSAATDLYGDAAGDLLGEIAANDASMTLNVSGNYTYVGLRSANGAIYVDQITIGWDGDTGEGGGQGGGGGDTYTMPAADSQLDVPTAWNAIDQGLEEGKSSADKYYVSGTITSIDEISPKQADGSGYGNATFSITDAKGSNYVLLVYRAKGFDNAEITDENFIKEGDNVTVYGKLQKYKDSKTGEIKYEISSCYITKVNGNSGGSSETLKASSIGRLTNDMNNKTVKLTLNNAEVVHAWTSNNGNTQVFVRDKTAACQFYNIGFDLAKGDILNGSITAKYTLYNGNPEMTTPVTDNSLSISSGPAEPQPQKITIADAKNYLCDLVEISNVSLIPDPESSAKGTRAETTKYYIVDDSDNQLQIYNGFHDSAYDDLHEFLDQSDKTIIKGIIISTKTDPELYIVEIVSPAGVNGIAADTKANGPIYNVAGQRVNKAVKGVYIQNGKKFVVK